MTASGSHWRPPSTIPPWLAAILTVAGVLLTINSLPMLAEAITPEHSSPSVVSAATIPATGPQASAPQGSAPQESARQGSAPQRSAPKAAASKTSGSRVSTTGVEEQFVAKGCRAATEGKAAEIGALDCPSLSGSGVAGRIVHGDSAGSAAAAPRKVATDPLPGTGGRTLPQLAIGLGLLCGGLGLLVMVGFSGARPWPGRYVRRIG